VFIKTLEFFCKRQSGLSEIVGLSALILNTNLIDTYYTEHTWRGTGIRTIRLSTEPIVSQCRRLIQRQQRHVYHRLHLAAQRVPRPTRHTRHKHTHGTTSVQLCKIQSGQSSVSISQQISAITLHVIHLANPRVEKNIQWAESCHCLQRSYSFSQAFRIPKWW